MPLLSFSVCGHSVTLATALDVALFNSESSLMCSPVHCCRCRQVAASVLWSCWSAFPASSQEFHHVPRHESMGEQHVWGSHIPKLNMLPFPLSWQKVPLTGSFTVFGAIRKPTRYLTDGTMCPLSLRWVGQASCFSFQAKYIRITRRDHYSF